MKKVFVDSIQERDRVETTFLVRDKIVGMAKNGRPYMTLKLMDSTGEVEGRIWDRIDEFSARFSKDDFVQVQGKASVYMGKMQLIIQELDRLEESAVNLGDYLPVSARPIDEMIAELDTVVAGLEDPALKDLMQAFLADQDFIAGYSRAPAAKAMHHACLGGLLEHSLAVAGLARDVGFRYPDIDRDLLIVSALLHDIGKVVELNYRRSFEYTDEGKLLGHIVIGVQMLEEKINSLPDFPRPLAIHLKHLLLSHHGQYDYGSPKRPKTLEAVVLNFIDDLDSKINGVRTHIDREPDRDSSWTQYHRHYDRYFFKGTAALDQAAPGLNNAEPRVSPDRCEPAQPSRPRRVRFSNTLEEQLKKKLTELPDSGGQENNNE